MRAHEPRDERPHVGERSAPTYTQGGPTPIPATPLSAVCNGNIGTDCVPAELNRLVDRMDDFNDKITAANVRISYHRSGLGYVGRPMGPVVTTTLELGNIPLYLPIMNALLGFDFVVPIFKVTITSEDLSTSKL